MFRMSVGFSEKDVSRRELREAQKAFLQGSLNDEQRALVDACLSRVILQANDSPFTECVSGTGVHIHCDWNVQGGY